MVIPLLMPADWCLEALRDRRGYHDGNGIFLECESVQNSPDGFIPFSGGAMTKPLFIGGMDMICLIVFSGVKWYRFKKRKRDKYVLYRDSIFAILVLIATIDILYSIITFQKQFIANLLRPIILVLCYKS